MKRCLISLSFLLCLPALSQELDGNILHAACQRDSVTCSTLIVSFAQGVMYTQFIQESTDESSKKHKLFCPPSGNFSNQQVIDIVKSYLEKNPVQRHRKAYTLIYQALAEKIGC